MFEATIDQAKQAAEAFLCEMYPPGFSLPEGNPLVHPTYNKTWIWSGDISPEDYPDQRIAILFEIKFITENQAIITQNGNDFRMIRDVWRLVRDAADSDEKEEANED